MENKNEIFHTLSTPYLSLYVTCEFSLQLGETKDEVVIEFSHSNRNECETSGIKNWKNK